MSLELNVFFTARAKASGLELGLGRKISSVGIPEVEFENRGDFQPTQFEGRFAKFRR